MPAPLHRGYVPAVSLFMAAAFTGHHFSAAMTDATMTGSLKTSDSAGFLDGTFDRTPYNGPALGSGPFLDAAKGLFPDSHQ